MVVHTIVQASKRLKQEDFKEFEPSLSLRGEKNCIYIEVSILVCIIVYFSLY